MSAIKHISHATRPLRPKRTFEVPFRANADNLKRLIAGARAGDEHEPYFQASVHTDLPERHRAPPIGSSVVQSSGSYMASVHAVAACRWGGYNGFRGSATMPGGDLEHRLNDTATTHGAAAWLCVSGDQTLWKNPNPRRPSIETLLELASEVRSGLQNPPDVWVAYNPLLHDATTEARRLALKASLGASVAVTQPPSLLPDRARAAYDTLDDVGLALPKLVGIAAPNSSARFAKWLELCNVDVRRDDVASKALKAWVDAEKLGDAAFREFRVHFVSEAMRDALQSVPGAIGIHVMPWNDDGIETVVAALDDL
ncbi:hypothetical protein PPROV_001045700 [Pycnococcus provasolii]|uniref:Methylenetetrahydrofolate reductase (NAD(P)H) n=1 Tax=Pycnococcus provasolii TaxID=41880 RepID=A0A830I3W9_9CHLO|nr:hypothetical protein PPROV_001045700 [Pycnococcus provasolii]